MGKYAFTNAGHIVRTGVAHIASGRLEKGQCSSTRKTLSSSIGSSGYYSISFCQNKLASDQQVP